MCRQFDSVLNHFLAGLAQLVEQLTCNQQVGGSSPLAGTMEEPLAQLVEHLTFNQRVRGSNPLWLTICGCGGIGRRTRFRIQRLTAWGFDSLHPHMQKQFSGRIQPCQGWGRGFESRLLLHYFAGVAELADAQDLKSCGERSPYRFDSGPRHCFIFSTHSSTGQSV